jgi:hypothetical protein
VFIEIVNKQRFLNLQREWRTLHHLEIDTGLGGLCALSLSIAFRLCCLLVLHALNLGRHAEILQRASGLDPIGVSSAQSPSTRPLKTCAQSAGFRFLIVATRDRLAGY